MFITVVTTTVFAQPQDLVERLAAAGIAGAVFVLFSAASIAGSVLCAVTCLYSRLSDARLGRIADQQFGVDPTDRNTYSPRIAGWFGFIASISRSARREGGLAAARFMPEYLQVIDRDAEREMLASQVVALSQNVLLKHRWVDRGWVLAGGALVGLVAFGLAYVVGTR